VKQVQGQVTFESTESVYDALYDTINKNDLYNKVVYLAVCPDTYQKLLRHIGVVQMVTPYINLILVLTSFLKKPVHAMFNTIPIVIDTTSLVFNILEE